MFNQKKMAKRKQEKRGHEERGSLTRTFFFFLFRDKNGKRDNTRVTNEEFKMSRKKGGTRRGVA
jgi:hypothetical protein